MQEEEVDLIEERLERSRIERAKIVQRQLPIAVAVSASPCGDVHRADKL